MKQTLGEKIFEVADKIQLYSLYAIAFFIPISMALIESFVGFALLGFIVKKMIVPDFTFIRSRIHFLLLVFYIFCGFSLLNSGQHIDKSFHALFFKWGQYILIFFMVQDALFSGERIKNAARILLFTGCLVAIDGVFQFFCGWEFLRGRKIMVIVDEGVKAITGPFPHYNSFAAYLICPVTVCMTTILSKNEFKFSTILKNKAIYCGMFLSLFMLLGCSLLTLSRGGWIGLLFAIILILFLSSKRKFIVAFLSFVILVLIFIPHIRERFLFTFTFNGDASRFALWKGAWGMIKEHPLLGNGIGTFMANFSKFTKGLGVQYAHNCYLQIWAETGVFALISFVSFISLLLWQGILSFRKSQDYTVLGLTCAIFGFLVHSFFDNHFYSLQLVVLFWFLAGMLVAVTKNSLKEIL